MIKVAAAIIKNGNNVLLMRRATGHSFAGEWEYPGGKVESNERITQALKRELKEELNINAKIGNLITSVRNDIYEIYAYDIQSFSGDITMKAHNAMKWVPISEVAQHPQLPADRKISEKISQQKDVPDLDLKAHVFAYRNVSVPNFDKDSGVWVVRFIENDMEKTQTFQTREHAFLFFTDKAKEIIVNFKLKINLYTTTHIQSR